MRDLTFLFDDNGTFKDYTLDAQDFLRDKIEEDVIALEDKFYIGLYKPFRNIYIEMDEALVNQEITYEYYNGTVWQPFNVIDETKNLSRSGFVRWTPPSNWSEVNVNGLNLFWIRASLSVDASVSIMGANLVFSDDNELSKHQRDALNFLAKGDKSFIAYHVSSRDEIIQRIRNSGVATRKTLKTLNDFTKWDVLDIDQIKEAATHLCLAKINFDISEGETDKYYQKYKDHMAMFGASYKLYYRTLDLNDDGIIDEQLEKMQIRSITLSKV